MLLLARAFIVAVMNSQHVVRHDVEAVKWVITHAPHIKCCICECVVGLVVQRLHFNWVHLGENMSTV